MIFGQGWGQSERMDASTTVYSLPDLVEAFYDGNQTNTEH